jgi:hypothetical protein
MSENCTEFYTKNQEPPDQICWCGDDFVCCLWTSEQIEKDFCILLIVGLNGSFHKIKFNTDYVKLIPEMDGVRILTKTECDFIHKIAGLFFSLMIRFFSKYLSIWFIRTGSCSP